MSHVRVKKVVHREGTEGEGTAHIRISNTRTSPPLFRDVMTTAFGGDPRKILGALAQEALGAPPGDLSFDPSQFQEDSDGWCFVWLLNYWDKKAQPEDIKRTIKHTLNKLDHNLRRVKETNVRKARSFANFWGKHTDVLTCGYKKLECTLPGDLVNALLELHEKHLPSKSKGQPTHVLNGARTSRYFLTEDHQKSEQAKMPRGSRRFTEGCFVSADRKSVV